MRRLSPLYLTLAIAIAVVLAGCADSVMDLTPVDERPDAPALALAAEADAQADRHLVVFNGKAPKDFAERVAEAGGTVVLNHEIGVAVVTGLDDEAAESLKGRVKAKYVEPAPLFHLVAPAAVREPAPAAAVADAGVVSAEDPTQAILYADQWNLHRIGAEAAWASGRLGSSNVTVAILDTGIDYLLPDLDGLVDLNRSTSFVELDDLYLSIFFPGRHVSSDLHYHGTNVATQVASNAWAFAGVTSRTTLMSVKVCGFTGSCPGVFEGILYAIDNGADVINMSLGGQFEKSANPGAVSVFNSIINYANQKGVTLVVAAGNDAIDLDRNRNVPVRDAAGNIIDRVHAPSLFHSYCSAPHVICVSSTRRGDVPASYTNYGRSVIDVSAPGGDDGDWVYALCPLTSLVFFCEDGYYPLGVAGTSQAAPHVAGLAALAVEDVGRSPAQVRNRIRNSADAVDGNGNSPYHGKGRINVARMVGATP